MSTNLQQDTGARYLERENLSQRMSDSRSGNAGESYKDSNIIHSQVRGAETGAAGTGQRPENDPRGMGRGYSRLAGSEFTNPSYSRGQPQSEYMSHSANPFRRHHHHHHSHGMQQPSGKTDAYMASSLPITGVDPRRLPPVDDLPKKLKKTKYRPGANLPRRNLEISHTSGVIGSGYGHSDPAWEGRSHRRSDSYDSWGERHSMPERSRTIDPIGGSKIDDAGMRHSAPVWGAEKILENKPKKTTHKKEGFLTKLAKAIFARTHNLDQSGILLNRTPTRTSESSFQTSQQSLFEIVEAMIKVQRVNPVTGIAEPFRDEGLFTTLKIDKTPFVDLGLAPNENIASFLSRSGIEFDSIIDLPTKNYIKGVSGLKPHDNIRFELLEPLFLSHGKNMQIHGVYQGGQFSSERPSYGGTPSRGGYSSEFGQQRAREPYYYSGERGNYSGRGQWSPGKQHKRHQYGRQDRGVMTDGQEMHTRGLEERVKDTSQNFEQAASGEGQGSVGYSERKGEHYMGHEEPLRSEIMGVSKKLEPEFMKEGKNDYSSEKPMMISKRTIIEEERHYGAGQNGYNNRDNGIGQKYSSDKGVVDKGVNADKGGYFDKGQVRTNEPMYGFQ